MTYLPFLFSPDWIDPNWSWTWLLYKWGANRFRSLTSWKMSISELTSLQKTLNVAIDTFKAELAAQNLTEPSLNTSKPHPIDEITYLPTPAMYEARRVALASLVCSSLITVCLLVDSLIGSYKILDPIALRCPCCEHMDGSWSSRCSFDGWDRTCNRPGGFWRRSKHSRNCWENWHGSA